MVSGKQPHILNASSNLLGICFVLVTGLKLTRMSADTWADEISLVSSVFLLASCVLSYISIRNEKHTLRYEKAADYSFLTGILLLFAAVLTFAHDFI
ncbi:MAG TPA: hypothetical protein VFR09_02760 [Alphaproteobacteria bacterium]|nr:hypothetical protein [Alphaproteobacteria bacterium]